MLDTFTCADCGETFSKVCTDEEALADSKILFGDMVEGPIYPEDCDIICELCLKRMFH